MGAGLQRDSKDDTKVAKSQRPNYELPGAQINWALLISSQKIVQRRDLYIRLEPASLQEPLQPTTPTNPHPSGMMAIPQATLCSRTFSTGENGNLKCGARSLKIPKPMRLAGIDMIETHPVCKPKYMLEKQIIVPTARPAKTPRMVKLCPGITRVAIFDMFSDGNVETREESV
ncbi:unnamed protein product [Fusarium venenatum]|uniref:Uncharacterized protein n=1 Tax=Fusarium venenatum TaxID=56646 RepID=A0A2L2TYI1_9HYPO|nr:uncharacterized protein FVRRES_10073 [Fusarium venenatum]CEI69996.1 unnamed protein product [Fusarium venenatum]